MNPDLEPKVDDLPEETPKEEPKVVEPGPEEGKTAVPDSDVDPKPEEGDDDPKPEEEPEKKFTQEELEATLGKRLAIERRKLERELKGQPDLPPLEIESQLNPDDFKSTEEYIEALATEKADALVKHKEAHKAVHEVDVKFQDQVYDAMEKYEDFEEVAFQHPFMTDVMAGVIKQSDIGSEIAYHLGKNLDLARSMTSMNPFQLTKEIIKLEGELTVKPKKPAVSKAPDPITPIQGKSNGNPVLDTTDPKSVDSMSATEWINKDRARRMKLAQGTH